MDYKELGNRVREARTIYGITQSNLAERVGCSVQHISHIETGHTKASLPLLVKSTYIQYRRWIKKRVR